MISGEVLKYLKGEHVVIYQNRDQPRNRQVYLTTPRAKCRLQAVRRVAAILDAVAMLPFIHRLLSRSEAFGQGRCRLIACLECSPDLGCCRRLLVKMDQHGCTPSRMSLRTDLAMKNADRRGSM